MNWQESDFHSNRTVICECCGHPNLVETPDLSVLRPIRCPECSHLQALCQKDLTRPADLPEFSSFDLKALVEDETTFNEPPPANNRSE